MNVTQVVNTGKSSEFVVGPLGGCDARSAKDGHGCDTMQYSTASYIVLLVVWGGLAGGEGYNQRI